LLVSDLSLKGLRVAETVHHVAAQTGNFKRSGLIINRVRTGEELARALTNTNLPLLGSLPEDETIYDYDSSGKSFLDLPECPSLQAARSILNL
ncbi:MAG: cobyrinic acid a,c-diamide synthase, partial [Dethiobacteria bacterium]|nr:cobyrinic acid a,c-diamide synthase [Dethiobacteria bacterium]